MSTLSPDERERLNENKVINRDKLWEQKKKPCADCGLRWHPHAMTFDHIDRKAITKSKNAKSMSAIVYYNPELFQRALNLTSVVCRNCHDIRELRRDISDPKISQYKRQELIGILENCKGALLKEQS